LKPVPITAQLVVKVSDLQFRSLQAFVVAQFSALILLKSLY
jgi:hypothetical protein